MERNFPATATNPLRFQNRVSIKFSSPEFLLLSFVVLYSTLSCWSAYRNGIWDRINFFIYAESFLSTGAVVFYVLSIFLCLRVLWWKSTMKPRPSVKTWWPLLVGELKITQRIGNFIPPYVGVFLFLTLFSNMKGLIPFFGAYKWDPSFAELDRFLHFGVDPWRLLQPILGYPVITKGIDILYVTWFPFMIFFLYWQLLSLKRPVLRLQFIFTFVLTWGIGGTLLAIWFASAGPCYYNYMVGNNYYAELSNYLFTVDQEYSLVALKLQTTLLDAYKNHKLIEGVGISAMPSMHVAIALIYYLLTRRINRKVGYFFAFYFIAVLIGSIHLGWHYAIDGYVSILITLGFWKLSQYVIEKMKFQVAGLA